MMRISLINVQVYEIIVSLVVMALTTILVAGLAGRVSGWGCSCREKERL